MHSSSLRLSETMVSGFRPGTMNTVMRGGSAGARADAASALRLIDIFDAVWEGAMVPQLAPRIEISSGRVNSVELINCYQHPHLGVFTSGDFLSCLNTEQARTLFLCDLTFVQEKLRVGGAETRNLVVDIPTDAAALATLGSEVRIIAHQTPDLFERVEFTMADDAMRALSQSQLAQLAQLVSFGIRFNMRVAGDLTVMQSDVPIRSIKLDPAVVRGVSTDGAQLQRLRSLVGVARKRGIRVVANGVDHAADLQLIKQEQCDEAQGELIGRSMRVEEFRHRLAGNPRAAADYRSVSSNLYPAPRAVCK